MLECALSTYMHNFLLILRRITKATESLYGSKEKKREIFSWKDSVTRWTIFLKVQKIKIVNFVWAFMVFTIFCCLVKNIQNKVFCLLQGHHLLIVKILPVNLFRKLVLAFKLPPVTPKVVSKASYDPENCSESGHKCTLENISQWEKRKTGTEIWCDFRNNF